MLYYVTTTNFYLFDNSIKGEIILFNHTSV